MKLSIKIFLGISLPAIIAILIISIFLINKTYDTYLEYETQNFINQINEIEKTISKSLESNISLDNLYTALIEYYQEKDIYLYEYYNDKLEYRSKFNNYIENKDILNVDEDAYKTKIQSKDGNYYLYISTMLGNNTVLVSVKSINQIYETRNTYIEICVVLVLISVFVIAIFAYIISKTLTKPLNKMNQEMIKLSKGNYDINLPEGKNEVGILAKNFNNMSNEIKRRNEELVDLVNSKQLFIDNLSHEMNTPLTSILGYADLLQKANLQEEQKIKFLRYIRQESERILDMYKKLLLISYKMNSDFEKKDVNIEAVFNEIIISFENRLKEQNIELIVNNYLQTILGDETLILMCVSNLVKNAINVSSVGTNIILNAYERNGFKYIEVIDQGSGISKEDIDKIIEPFYRVDKVRSRKNGGAGLGLSICKSIMEMHNGNLRIESELGKGSMFILEFKE